MYVLYYCKKPHTHTIQLYKSSTYTILHMFQYSVPVRSLSLQNHISWKPIQISAAIASQLHLNLSNVLKLQGLTKYKCSAGPMSHRSNFKDNETYSESDCHKTVGSKSVSSHGPLQLTDGKPIP